MSLPIEQQAGEKQPGELGRRRTAAQMQASDTLFYASMMIIGGAYVFLILAMLAADGLYMISRSWQVARLDPQPWVALLNDNPIVVALRDPRIQYSIWLTLVSCTMSAILSVFVAIPTGYLLARHRFFGQRLVDAVLDIPIVLPPLVVGLSLLVLFQFPPFSWAARSIVYQIPAVVIAQFSVACAFAVRTMKSTFDHINPRCEQVALTLGCSQAQAFGWVVLPESYRGVTTALTLAWARSLGEFGPLLIFAGTTRMKTEVLSTSVFLEMNVGRIEAAVAVSLIMVFAAMLVLIVARLVGAREVAA